MRHTYIVERLFDGENFHNDIPVTVEDDRILGFETINNTPQTKLKGLLVPGFIDVQVNGGAGVLFNDNPTLQGIEQISNAHIGYGTSSSFPTVITDELAVMKKAADAVSEALKAFSPAVLGIHFEGPHISSEKKGVHSEDYIRELTNVEMELYAREDIGIKHITIAPEKVSPDVIKTLVKMGVIVSLGHSNADYDCVIKAVEAGARGFTHLFNAMSPMQGREPGMVGAALTSDECWCGIIADGHHAHWSSLKLAINSKPKGKIILVTDAMPPVGSKDHKFMLYEQNVYRNGNKLTLKDGRLAGSALDMATAVRNVVKHINICLPEALRMASLYPAQYLGIDNELGRIKKGYVANFTLLDNNNKPISTWINGTKIHQIH
jgi:N-acetylglucosamine-6-phosphate deacetylase